MALVLCITLSLALLWQAKTANADEGFSLEDVACGVEVHLAQVIALFCPGYGPTVRVDSQSEVVELTARQCAVSDETAKEVLESKQFEDAYNSFFKQIGVGGETKITPAFQDMFCSLAANEHEKGSRIGKLLVPTKVGANGD